MPRETTYGFEAEFDINAQSVMHRLHEVGLADDDHLHGYHCDCSSCCFRNGYPFRGQTDSSCSGEIISDIFGSAEGYPLVEWDNTGTHWSEYGLMVELCRAAVDVDAEPGPNSGLHVHVGKQGLNRVELARSFYEYIRWEPVLMRVAGGRWTNMRDNNDPVREMVSYEYEINIGEPLTSRSMANHETPPDVRGRLMDRHQGHDRHSNLNIGSRSRPTWEFRLGNSTRSAWRIRMFCELSKAFMDPKFIEHVEGLNPPQRFRRPSAGINLLAQAADQTGYDETDLPESLLRQAHYLDEIAADAPALLTIG